MSELGHLRLMIAMGILLLALLAARLSWQIPFMVDAERALYDLRSVLFSERVEQDKRIMMIVYNDDTLIDARKRSPLDRGILARALQNLDQMGAKSIGIDILIDQPQDEDEQLIAVFKSMRTPTHLAYANFATNQGQIELRQQEFLDQFVARLNGSNTRLASIRLSTDGDNVARSWPIPQPGIPPLLARAMAGTKGPYADYVGSIKFRLPLRKSGGENAEEIRPVFSSMPIDLFANAETAAAFAGEVAGRHVLIGGDIVDLDRFDTPLIKESGEPTIGLEVHAHILAQLLDGKVPSNIPSWTLWLAAGLVVIAAVLSSIGPAQGWRAAAAMLGQLALLGGLPFWLQSRGYDSQPLPAFGWIVGWIIAYATAATAAQQVGSQQRRFAQSALGKYLPKDIAQQIVEEPDRLALHGEKREIFVVFTDLEGFTNMSHKIEPEMVASLLNTYLDSLCGVILKYGGTIDKFVGDAVVAFWGAPIARPDDGERAAKAAYELWQAGEVFRKNAPPGVPPIGKTRVGMHFGEAVIGNFGGEGRIQYTALGDSMNTAARLESANKKTETGVLVSREAMERTGLDWWRSLGTVRLRGREKPVDIFEPVPQITEAERHAIKEALDMLNKNATKTIKMLEKMVADRPGDAALANLLKRTKKSSKVGGIYELD